MICDQWKLLYYTDIELQSGIIKFNWETNIVSAGRIKDSLGNLIQRVLTIINKNFDGKLNKIKEINENDKKLYEYPEKLLKTISKNYEKQELHKVIENIWKLISESNKYVDESAPWELVKSNKDRAGDVLNILVVVIAKIAIYLAPIMPSVSENILKKMLPTLIDEVIAING